MEHLWNIKTIHERFLFIQREMNIKCYLFCIFKMCGKTISNVKCLFVQQKIICYSINKKWHHYRTLFSFISSEYKRWIIYHHIQLFLSTTWFIKTIHLCFTSILFNRGNTSKDAKCIFYLKKWCNFFPECWI